MIMFKVYVKQKEEPYLLFMRGTPEEEEEVLNEDLILSALTNFHLEGIDEHKRRTVLEVKASQIVAIERVVVQEF